MNNRVVKAINHPAFPISLLVLVCLIAGSLTFKDYGMGWDEPLFYKYADAIPYAYSISARLSGDFNILKAYGPSETDHMMYGPAYILSARPLMLALMSLTGANEPASWHFTNFIFFLVGVIFIYLFALKWMSMWAAFSSSVFFATQPVLWGHAFINPKDIPFTVFFIIAFYTGYRMVEKSTIFEISNDKEPRQVRKIILIILWVLFGTLLVGSIAAITFKAQIQAWIPSILQVAFNQPDSIPGFLFRLMANNSGDINPEAYISKALSLFTRLPTLVFIVSTLVGLISALATFKPSILFNIHDDIRLNMSWPSTLIAGFFLGFLAAIRILGPLAGFLVSLYFVFRFKKRAVWGIILYGAIAFVFMYILWPYIWRSPLGGIIAVIKHMANNPQNVPVLFKGQVISSLSLPADYFLTMIGLTLTEPVWPMFIIGSAIAMYMVARHKLDWKGFFPFALWLLLPLAYIILMTPPQYDGFRHFTFITPPVFVITGFVFHKIFEVNKINWLNPILVMLAVIPGIIGIVNLHPYPYTYYNSFIGGTKGAFRKYETDYWLTCYKEAFDNLNNEITTGKNLYVHKNKYLASQYAGDLLSVEQFDPNQDTTQPGDLLLLSSRSNYDQQYHVDDPEWFSIGRDGAVFCSVRTVQ